MPLSLHSPYALLSEFNNGVLVMGMVERFGMGRPWVGQVGMWARLPLCLHHRHYRQVGLSGLQVSQGSGVASGWVKSLTGDQAFIGCCFHFWWVSPVVPGSDNWRPMLVLCKSSRVVWCGTQGMLLKDPGSGLSYSTLWTQFMVLRNSYYIRMIFTLVCPALAVFI